MITLLTLKELLPTWYTGLLEFETLMRIEQGLLEELVVSITRAEGNLYVSTADNETITLYERMLRIARQPDDTLDMRRFRVLTRLASQKPYTIRYLTELLNSIGEDVTISCIYDEYQLIINSAFEQRGQMADVDYLIRTIVPANLSVVVDNVLRTNAANLSLKQAAALTSYEVVYVTHDFNAYQAAAQPMTVAAANVDTEMYQITHDFNAYPTATAVANAASGTVLAGEAQVTHDYMSNTTVDSTFDTAGGVVSAYFYDIN